MSDADRTPPLPFVTDVTVQPGDVVFATDRRGQLVHWNKEAEQLFGYAASEVIGNPFDIICLGAPGGSGIDLRTILAGRDFAGGVRCFDKSGREIALYVYATAGRKPSGTAAGVVFVARDVSEFWRAEQAVRTAEDKYQMLFEHSSDAVAIADIAGRVLEVNPALLRLYGYTADEARGMRLADSVATESRAEADKAMADLAAGKTVTRTIKMTRKDGTRFVVDLVASVVSVKGARRILSVTRDVTERVRAEEATNESERKYRAVFESANDAVLLETVDGRILDVNENACVLLGYTKKELLALGVSDLVPPEARAWLPRVTDAILQDRTFRAEAVNVHKSGRHIPVEISASTMQVDDRTLVLAIVRDISERKRAEAALAESENRYRTLFNDSLMGIYRTSPDGQIQLANPALIRMLGYESFARLAERNLETAGSGPEYRRDEFKRRLERDGRIVGLEARWQTRDGRTLFVRESAHAVCGPDGAVLYYEGTVEDISDRRAAEQALRESEERFRRLVDSSPDGIAVYQNEKVVIANQACAALLGYDSPDALVGRRASEFVNPDDMAIVVEREKAMQGRPAGQAEGPLRIRFWRRDGAWMQAEVVGAVTTWKGAPAMQVMVRDITERRELARAAAEAAAQAILANSPDGIAAECDGAIAYANQRFAELYGYDSPAQVTGRPVTDFLAPEDHDRVAEYSAARTRGEPAPTRYRFKGLRRDSTLIEVEITVSTYRLLGKQYLLGFLREAPSRPRR
jgi:PAS domain S-box-containing protein